MAQIARLRTLFAGLPWWDLVPDTDDALVTSGRGTRLRGDAMIDVLDNDFVTAARTPDGRTAVIYVPSARTITIDRGSLAAGATASWIDPASGARQPVALAESLTTPGRNSAGDGDWVLLVTTSG